MLLASTKVTISREYKNGTKYLTTVNRVQQTIKVITIIYKKS